MATITGTNANDKLYSGHDDDEIFGSAGNDIIYYGNSWGDYEAAHGNDAIDGGSGVDTCGSTTAPKMIGRYRISSWTWRPASPSWKAALP
jgi:hypothetical protein